MLESTPTEKQKLGLPVYKWGDSDLKLTVKDKIIVTVRTAKLQFNVQAVVIVKSICDNQKI